MPSAISLVLCFLATATPVETISAPVHARCLAVLHEALAEGKEWVKVHAAESLIWTGNPESVRDVFLKELPGAWPKYRIGVWRVLAQAAPDQAERQQYEDKILAALLDSQGPDRQHAAETLGKLGVSSHDPAVQRLAATETGAFQSMAQWVLANGLGESDEARLAELLASNNADTRGCAAYALRFFKQIRPSTLEKLEAAANKESLDSPWRCNILSPWYLHAPAAKRPAIRAQLLEYAERGNKDEKRELCAALGRLPNAEDIPVLIRLLDDPDLDARAGAAEALLRIERERKPNR